MPARLDKTALLDRVTALCLALPEAERELRGSHADFRVRKRPFAYFLDDHHGDGIVSVCCRTELGENVDRAGRDPERFYLPAYIGKKGWVGVRLDAPHVDWHDIGHALAHSWRLAAPKTLAARLDATQQTEGAGPVGHQAAKPEPAAKRLAERLAKHLAKR